MYRGSFYLVKLWFITILPNKTNVYGYAIAGSADLVGDYSLALSGLLTSHFITSYLMSFLIVCSFPSWSV